jgi:hypothetical protein
VLWLTNEVKSWSSDGTAFRIGLRDADGREAGLVFPSDAVKALMMSLFRVGDTAFKRLLNDDTARLVYPIENARLQASPGTDRLILVFTTTDGFEAAFAVEPKVLLDIAMQAHAHSGLKAKLAHKPN